MVEKQGEPGRYRARYVLTEQGSLQTAKIRQVIGLVQENADKNIAQAKAEERRAMAVASEQEMKAKAQEARAKVIEAEAEVPKAMAEAFRNGNLGIMDYYRMKNIEADTSMRENIAKPTTGISNQPLSK